MKQIALILTVIALLVLAGCEKETSPRIDRYKYRVQTDVDSVDIQYIDSTGVEKRHYVYGSWEYAWTQVGYRPLRMIATTNCGGQFLSISIERNDTTIAASSGPAPIPQLYVVAYW